MGDLRKQIRHLEAQVQGFLSVMRDFNERLVKQDLKIMELETKVKELEEKTDRSGEDHVL